MADENAYGDSLTYFRTPVGAPEGHPLTPPNKISAEGFGGLREHATCAEGTHDDLPDFSAIDATGT